MSESVTVKAVGFACFSPEVIVMFADHDRDQLHIFPPKSGGVALDFQEDGRRHVVLLRALDKISMLSKYANKIHRLIVFADSSELTGLNLPIMDMEATEDGGLSPAPRQPRDQLLDRIDSDAVDLRIDAPVNTVKRAVQKAAEVAAYTGPTFRQQLRDLRDSATAKDKKFNFIDDVGIPSVLRLMGDTSRDEFKSACRNMISTGGISEEKVKLLFRWVEGIDDSIGPELGKAVDAYLFDDENEELTVEQAAAKYGVDVKDVEFVANTYEQLLDDEEKEDEFGEDD